MSPSYIILLALGFSLFTMESNAQKITSESQEPKPNILIILTDDQGYHDVSYYGTKDIRTPNMDELCRAGMRFDNFYANSPVCAPTRAALMTGKYPDFVGVPG